MEHYDVIIIGAGIAGCGLAYNLKKMDYKGNVLIIDGKEVGANAAYGYRNTCKEIIDQYHLKYDRVFKGIKIGTQDQTHITINKKFYFINYQKTCNHFIKKSQYTFKQEFAKDIYNKILITNKNKYSFTYIVDASGHNFFLKKKKKKILPSRYWMGVARILKNKVKLDNYFYHQFSNGEYLEDFYPLKNKTLQGDWKYTKKLDFGPIQIPQKTLYKKYIVNPIIEKITKVAIPCAHTPPLIQKNYVCLGDSFGNAYTSSAAGIQPILESSLILTNAIKNKNLFLFQKQWKEKYHKNYTKFLISKYDTFHNHKIIKFIKNYPTRIHAIKLMEKYPKTFLKILENDDSIKFPPELKKIFPRHQKIFQLAYWILINAKYKKEEINN